MKKRFAIIYRMKNEHYRRPFHYVSYDILKEEDGEVHDFTMDTITEFDYTNRKDAYDHAWAAIEAANNGGINAEFTIIELSDANTWFNIKSPCRYRYASITSKFRKMLERDPHKVIRKMIKDAKKARGIKE